MALRQIVERLGAVEDVLTRVPSTVQSTEAVSPPVADGMNIGGSSAHIPGVEGLQDTEWAIYTPKIAHENRNYYYDKLVAHFKEVNGGNRFRLLKTRDHIRIQDGNESVFRCARTVLNARNLYLELHAFQYDCGAWLAGRTNVAVDFYNTPTPPGLLGAR